MTSDQIIRPREHYKPKRLLFRDTIPRTEPRQASLLLPFLPSFCARPTPRVLVVLSNPKSMLRSLLEEMVHNRQLVCQVAQRDPVSVGICKQSPTSFNIGQLPLDNKTPLNIEILKVAAKLNFIRLLHHSALVMLC